MLPVRNIVLFRIGPMSRKLSVSLSPRGVEPSYSYESAIKALNSLQTNAEVLQKVRKERQKNVHLNLPLTIQYLERSGMSLEDLANLKIIHVSGTKGKGSTCAFCESILRQYGLRTGFYSSPHLVSATERVRLDGQPISKEKFAEYFWSVYDRVCRGRGPEDRPHYFKFMTVLAFNIFHRERVDVAIIEVGIGGAYDCTNILPNPVVTGITALGLDHTSILGKTIPEIAWHKAGIMKPGVQTYIDGEQPEDAIKVIAERSQEIGCHVAKVPQLEQYDWGRFPFLLGLYGKVQMRNASLALALSRHFLATQGKERFPGVSRHPQEDIQTMEPFPLQAETALGLRLTDWPGRSQVIDHDRMVYFLDGAHTEESIQSCRTWFSVASKLCRKKSEEKIFKVLIFNMTGDREPRVLLQPFINSDLDLVVFCTNTSRMTATPDQENLNSTHKIQMDRCEAMLQIWSQLQSGSNSYKINTINTNNKTLRSGGGVPGVIIPSINDALLWLSQGTDPNLTPAYHSVPVEEIPAGCREADQVQVLVTGSLHLVGGVIACLKPDGSLPAKQVDPKLVAAYYNLVPKHRVNCIPGMT